VAELQPVALTGFAICPPAGSCPDDDWREPVVRDNGFQDDDAYREWQEQRARRVEKNEQSFRAYNERRSEFEREAIAHGDAAPFVCECGDRGCHQAMNLTVEQFEASHRRPDQFAVLPGHIMPEFEEVVEQYDHYWVLRKFSTDEIAEQSVSASE
jgi:hypothetical protein